MTIANANDGSPQFDDCDKGDDGRRPLEHLQLAPRRAAFWEGFSTPGAGFAYMVKNPELWSYAVVPVVLNLLITALAFVLFLLAVVGFIVHLHPRFSPGWGGLAIEILCAVGLLALALFATLITWILLQRIVCGRSYAKLARAVELRLGIPPEAIQDLSFRQQLSDTLRDLISLIAINIGLLFLHLIPVLGSIGSIAGALYFDCYLLGREYLDFPLALRGWSRREKLALARKYRGQTLGLGAIVLLVTLLPVISSVVLTAAVVGSVLLHRRLASLEACVGRLDGKALGSPCW